MMRPTVGRIVHYHHNETGELRAAIVTTVAPDGEHVGLSVYPKWGGPAFQPTPVIVPFSEEPKPGHWSWPPRV